MTYANVKTNLPGTFAKDLLERREKAVPRGVSNGIPTFAKEAKGAIVTDVDGNTYIDFAGAIGTLNVGHNHPKVVAALQNQLNHFIHTGFNVMMYEPYVELAEKLAALAPGSDEKSDFPKQRRRSSRKCGQNRTQIYETPGHHQLLARIPWQNINDDVNDK